MTQSDGVNQDYDNNNDNNKHLTEAERNLQSNNGAPVYTFVITGGPCGGKTTAMARLHPYLRNVV